MTLLCAACVYSLKVSSERLIETVASMDFIVGTFNTPELYMLRFHPSTSPNNPAKLEILKSSPAIGSHSWLALSQDKKHLYATAWTEPPSIAAYHLHLINGSITAQLLNSKPVKARSGYVCCSQTHVYSAGGPTGEVFCILENGSLGELVQELSFIDESLSIQPNSNGVKHGDFGGLRHGAHSVDLSPDGRNLYVADIGRNCVWTFTVNGDGGVQTGHAKEKEHLTLGMKSIAPREGDGPRHCTVHPSGRYLYSLQEHTSMVDVFEISEDGCTLRHVQGVKIIPEQRDPKLYWADEVRLSTVGADGKPPRYMYASTRGLEASTMGYVAVFALDEGGKVASETPIDMYETATSGGIANAVEPAPRTTVSGDVEYLALTDSEEGFVFALSFDGSKIKEEARIKLGDGDDKVCAAATAVWL